VLMQPRVPWIALVGGLLLASMLVLAEVGVL